MRLAVLMMFVVGAAQAQFTIGADSIHSQNVWRWTDEQLKNAYYMLWEGQLRADTVRLRPGQNVTVHITDGTLKVTLDSVGIGPFRQSYYTAHWHRDTGSVVGVGFDTTFYPVMPNLNYGESDCNGIVLNPSLDSLTSGGTWGWVFQWRELSIIPIRIEGLGSSIITLNRFILSDNPKADSTFGWEVPP